MKARTRKLPFQSIKARLLLLLLSITLLAVIILAVVAITTVQSEGQNAQRITTHAMRLQAEAYLMQMTTSSARENDLVLRRVQLDVQKTADFVSAVYNHPAAFAPASFWNIDDHIFEGEDGQYLNSRDDVSSAFVPNTIDLNESVRRDLELSAYLDLIFPAIQKSNPNVEAIYYGSINDMTRYYPNIGLGEVVPGDFQATGRPWFVGSTPQQNPDKKTWWVSPYVDATGLGTVTTAAAPVYDQAGTFIGVVGFDVTLTEMVAAIKQTRVLETGYFFLIDKDGNSIALPEQAYRDILNRTPEEDEVTFDLKTLDTDFAPIITKMLAGESGFEEVQIQGKDLFVAYAPLESAGWSIGSVVEGSEVFATVEQIRSDLDQTTRTLVLTYILPISLGIILLVIVAAVVFTNYLVSPLQQLAQAAEKLKTGQWDAKIPTPGTAEVGVLAQAFQAMAAELHKMVEQLEQRVVERTQQLERRKVQLQVASEVSRDAASARQVDTLLNRAVNLIRDRFGFYHAGIFLNDDQGEFSVLRAATGEAGQTLLKNQHQLKIGATGIVGFVAGSGSPRIAGDVGTDLVHFKNPLLPETRSEMAVPLKLGKKVIGVLDVQSREEAAFEQEDIAILQILADQLAVALENAHLLEEAQKSLSQLQSLYKRMDEEAWKRVGESSSLTGYQYNKAGSTPLLKNPTSKKNEAEVKIEKAPISLPLMVRGQVIGSLDVWPEGESWSAEEVDWLQAVGDRVSQAMDSARLFEQAQRRAAREQTLNQLVSGFARSLEFDALLQSAVLELGRLPNVAEVTIQVGSGPHAISDNGNDLTQPLPVD